MDFAFFTEWLKARSFSLVTTLRPIFLSSSRRALPATVPPAWAACLFCGKPWVPRVRVISVVAASPHPLPKLLLNQAGTDGCSYDLGEPHRLVSGRPGDLPKLCACNWNGRLYATP